MNSQRIPGIHAMATTDLPVLLPFRYRTANEINTIGFSAWLVSASPWLMLVAFALLVLWPLTALAAGYDYGDATRALIKWLPFLVVGGFLFNLLISLLTMLLGTIAGIVLGLAQISPIWLLRVSAKFATQLFRNSPWLVLLFIVLLALPFEIVIGDLIITVPDWVKAVFGLSLPIMANISEVVRGGNPICSDRSVGSCRISGIQSTADSLANCAAAVLQENDSTLDELVCDSNHGYSTVLLARCGGADHFEQTGD